MLFRRSKSSPGTSDILRPPYGLPNEDGAQSANLTVPSPSGKGAKSEVDAKKKKLQIAHLFGKKVKGASHEAPTAAEGEGSPADSNKKAKSTLRGLIKSVVFDGDAAPAMPSAALNTNKGNLFGVPLTEAVERSQCLDGLPLCRVFQDCIMYLETFGLQREGIYRVPGFRTKMEELKRSYNRGDPVKLSDFDPMTVAMLLKLYLRELPEPLLTRQLGASFEQTIQSEEESQHIPVLRRRLRDLPPENFATLAWLCLHMNHVSKHEKYNKMSLSNLIIVLSPTLLVSNTLLRSLCEHAQVLFPGVQLNPNTPIPEAGDEEEEIVPSVAATKANPVRMELIQMYLYVISRNDTLVFVKEQLKAQLRQQRQELRAVQKELEDAPKKAPSPSNTDEESLEQLGDRLRELDEQNEISEGEKLHLFNLIMAGVLECTDLRSEIRARQLEERA